MWPGWEKQANLRKGWRRTLWRLGKRECHVCGGPIAHESHATLEHVIPLAKGGDDTIANAALSHEECNRKRGTAEVIS